MRALPEAKLFSTHLIDDMHAAFEVVCSRLGLAPTSDKATELVVTKIVELAKAGRRGDALRPRPYVFSTPMSLRTRSTGSILHKALWGW